MSIKGEYTGLHVNAIMSKYKDEFGQLILNLLRGELSASMLIIDVESIIKNDLIAANLDSLVSVTCGVIKIANEIVITFEKSLMAYDLLMKGGKLS